MKKVPFDYIEETRLEAGFFVPELCDELGISERSWYRWKKENAAPRWVHRAVEILSGRLDYFGWDGGFICDGVLYRSDINPKYYSWSPGDLMEALFKSIQITIESPHGKQQREIRTDAEIQGSNELERFSRSRKGSVIAIEQGLEARRRSGLQQRIRIPSNGGKGGRKDRKTTR